MGQEKPTSLLSSRCTFTLGVLEMLSKSLAPKAGWCDCFPYYILSCLSVSRGERQGLRIICVITPIIFVLRDCASFFSVLLFVIDAKTLSLVHFVKLVNDRTMS